MTHAATHRVPPSAPALCLRGRTFDASRPAVMAIINRTPDSFYAGGRHSSLTAALDAVGTAVDAGADLIDVGGVRAGQEGTWVDAQAEIARVRPFLVQVRKQHPDLPLSLDTWRSEVAQACADVGLDLINDTWAGHDPRLVGTAAQLGAGIVCSHTGGLPPRTDPVAISYGPRENDVVDDVLAGLRYEAERAEAAGVPPSRILLDPTLDFGKTTRHSLAVLRHTADVVALGYPVMQAISRKDFIGETLGVEAAERLEGSLAATAVAAWNGVCVFRAHDVQATRRALDVVASIRGDRPPKLAARGEVCDDESATLLRHPRPHSTPAQARPGGPAASS